MIAHCHSTSAMWLATLLSEMAKKERTLHNKKVLRNTHADISTTDRAYSMLLAPGNSRQIAS